MYNQIYISSCLIGNSLFAGSFSDESSDGLSNVRFRFFLSVVKYSFNVHNIHNSTNCRHAPIIIGMASKLLSNINPTPYIKYNNTSTTNNNKYG